MKYLSTRIIHVALTALCALFPALAGANPYADGQDALSPADIVVLANASAPESVALAHYYAQKRGIPEANVVSLPMPDKEMITWDDYVSSIEEPLRAWLCDKGWIKESATSKDAFGRTTGIVMENRIGYLVLCQGVPLRVADDVALDTPTNYSDFLFIAHQKSGAKISPRLRHSYASVDSELAALTAPMNPVLGFVPNPLYKRTNFTGSALLHVVRTSRLGGPDYAAARSLVDSAIEGETRGLQGRAYIDKSGPFKLADSWFDSAVANLSGAGWDVQVDDKRTVFQPGDRFDAPAVYFGWYASAVEGPFLEPGMRFPAGAIAAHIYSFSAQNLDDDKQWCPAFIERGVAGTFGNANEPTLEFTHDIGIVTEAICGGWTFCDAAWSSMPVLSWQGVVFGDPLYRPMPWLASGSGAAKPSGEYPSLSSIFTLQQAGRSSEALAAAEEALAATHGYAIALKYAQMLHAAGRDADALEALQFVAKEAHMNYDQRSVALEIARFLGAMKDAETALAILEHLRGAETSAGFRAVVTDLGWKIAQASGRAEFIAAWPKDAAIAN